jgi:hypothetical protein
MNGNNNKNPLMVISTLLVLFAAMGVITYNKVPFKKLRPVSEINELSELVRARLWQDPFSVVFDYVQQAKRETENGTVSECCFLTNQQKKQVTKEGEKTGALQQTIKKRLDDGTITFLGVMVFGGPYADETESRIRQRYAVLSGLRRLGFVPEDPEHIGFIRIQTNDKSPEDQILLENILPFEWLHKEGKKEFVLLPGSMTMPFRKRRWINFVV